MVKQCRALRESQWKNLNILFFQFPQSPPGDHSLTTEPEDSGYEIDLTKTPLFEERSPRSSPTLRERRQSQVSLKLFWQKSDMSQSSFKALIPRMSIF